MTNRRWYRAPECLLTDGFYGPEMDLWGAGCVMFEITSLYPLFPGANEVDQITRIHKVLGTPPTELMERFKAKGSTNISLDFPEVKGIGIPNLIPHASAEAIDLIVKMLRYDASERITSREAMRHPYFREVRETESKEQTASTTAAAVASTTVKKEASNALSSSSTVSGAKGGEAAVNGHGVASKVKLSTEKGSLLLPHLQPGAAAVLAHLKTNNNYNSQVNNLFLSHMAASFDSIQGAH